MNLVITEQKKSKLRDPNVYKMFIPPFAGKAAHIMERKKKTNPSSPFPENVSKPREQSSIKQEKCWFLIFIFQKHVPLSVYQV